MAAEPTIARDFDLKINTGTVAVPVFTAISGITSIQPGNDSTKTDDSDFDSAGQARSTVVERSNSLQVDLNYKEDTTVTPATRDAGQQALLDAAKLIGAAGKKMFQYTTPGGFQYAFTASVDMALPGGGKTDLATTSVTLTIDGDITETPPA